MNLRIGGPTITSLDAVHAQIAESPGVPDWYGRNLDALSDLLGAGHRRVELIAARALHDALGEDDFDRLWATLVDAAVENPKLELIWGASVQ